MTLGADADGDGDVDGDGHGDGHGGGNAASGSAVVVDVVEKAGMDEAVVDTGFVDTAVSVDTSGSGGGGNSLGEDDDGSDWGDGPDPDPKPSLDLCVHLLDCRHMLIKVWASVPFSTNPPPHIHPNTPTCTHPGEDGDK